MPMKNKALILGVTLAILASGFWFSLQATEGNEGVAESQGNGMGTTYAHVSWAKYYFNFREVMNDRDLVIVGEVVDQRLDPEDEEYTLHEIKVLRMIKDSSGGVREGDVVTVRQYGGIWDPPGALPPVHVEIEDSPLMERGSVSMLFLHDRDNDRIYGGLHPQTRYVVRNGRISCLAAAYPNRNILVTDPNLEAMEPDIEELDLDIGEMGLEELISTLEGYKESPTP